MLCVGFYLVFVRALVLTKADIVWEDRTLDDAAHYVPLAAIETFPAFVLPLTGRMESLLRQPQPPVPYQPWKPVEPRDCYSRRFSDYELRVVAGKLTPANLIGSTAEVLSGTVTGIDVGVGPDGTVETRVKVLVDQQFRRTQLDLDPRDPTVQILEPGGELFWQGNRYCTEPNTAFLDVSLGEEILVGGTVSWFDPKFVERRFSGRAVGSGFSIADSTGSMLSLEALDAAAVDETLPR